MHRYRARGTRQAEAAAWLGSVGKGGDMQRQQIFVVDDETRVREAIRRVAEAMQIESECCSTAEGFLGTYNDEPGCLLAEQRLPGLNGLELQEELHRRGWAIPFILLCAAPRTTTTVRAIKNGAVTVLDKPCDEDLLWQAVRDALAQDRDQRERSAARQETLARFDALTPKEVDVLRLILAGQPNKSMASLLDVSLRTIENRRRKIFAKLGIGSVAQLVALALEIRLDRPQYWRNWPGLRPSEDPSHFVRGERD